MNADTSITQITSVLKGDIYELNYNLTPVNDAARSIRTIYDTVIIGGNASLVQRRLERIVNQNRWKDFVFRRYCGDRFKII